MPLASMANGVSTQSHAYLGIAEGLRLRVDFMPLRIETVLQLKAASHRV